MYFVESWKSIDICGLWVMFDSCVEFVAPMTMFFTFLCDLNIIVRTILPWMWGPFFYKKMKKKNL